MSVIYDVEKIFKSNVFKNFSYLSFSHIVNVIFPLFTFPYITRIFGPDGYGVLNFLQSFVAYFAVISDYGIGIIAPGLLSSEKNNHSKFSIIFHSILFIKIILSFVSFFLILLISYFSHDLKLNTNLIIIIFLGSVFLNNIYPGYFFQAIERMKYLAYINILIKFLSVLALFVFVNSQKDLSIYLWINTISIGVSSILGLFLVYYKFGLSFVMPSIESILDIFKKSTFSFFSVLCTNAYTISNFIFLGFYSGPYRIMYYFISFIFLLGQALYPKMAILSKSSINEGYKIVKKSFIYVLPFLVVISVIIFFNSKKIVLLLIGYEYLESYKALKIISIVPVFIFVSNMIGIQIILASNNLKLFLVITFLGLVLNLISNFFITINYGYVGASITFLITEFFVAFFSFLGLRRLLKNA